MKKLAIITSHPIQYYAPWFRHIHENTDLDVRVFYLWDAGISDTIDPEFNSSFKWDIPLLDGYEYEFVPNKSQSPGTGHFRGLVNPTLVDQVRHFDPDAVLMMIYNYQACLEFLLKWYRKSTPLLFRGDSHRLVACTGMKEAVKRQIISVMYSRFAALLYVGAANKEYYKLHGVDEERLFFAPHAVDNGRFTSQADEANAQAKEWRKDLGIPLDVPVVLFAGKFVEKKRPLDLLRAFKNTDSDAHLLMVGSGELEHQLKSEAADHKKIHFAPFQNQSQMPRTYAAADLLVLPSFGLSETWGLAVNEAMCLSRAAGVSSHVGCSRDIVRNDENGFVFEAGSQEDLTAKLGRALDSRERLARWGARSREIIENYSYRQTTAGLCEAVTAVTGASSGVRAGIGREKVAER